MKQFVIGDKDGSVREAMLKVLATTAPTTFTQTVFKDCETGEITSIMPENKMFEMTKQTFDGDFKSGKEKRRERRKEERKSKKK